MIEKKEEDRKEKAEFERKEALKNLFANLQITAHTINILVEHEIVTAAALTMIGVDKLEQLGIKIGQALEIKGRFNENGTRPSALQQSTIGAAVCVFDLICFLYFS